MTIANGHWSQPLAMLLPPFLALLGFVLAVEGRIGIVAARRAQWRWQQRLDDLVGRAASLIDWADTLDEGARDTRRAGELFAVRSPVMFMGAWVFLFTLPIISRVVVV